MRSRLISQRWKFERMKYRIRLTMPTSYVEKRQATEGATVMGSKDPANLPWTMLALFLQP